MPVERSPLSEELQRGTADITGKTAAQMEDESQFFLAIAGSVILDPPKRAKDRPCTPEERHMVERAREMLAGIRALHRATGWTKEELANLLSYDEPVVQAWWIRDLEHLQRSSEVVAFVAHVAQDAANSDRDTFLGFAAAILEGAAANGKRSDPGDSSSELLVQLGQRMAAREAAFLSLEILRGVGADPNRARQVLGSGEWSLVNLIQQNRTGTARFLVRQRIRLYRQVDYLDAHAARPLLTRSDEEVRQELGMSEEEFNELVASNSAPTQSITCEAPDTPAESPVDNAALLALEARRKFQR
jgi:hypothetical protein